MTVAEVARRHYLTQVAVGRRTVADLAKVWAAVDIDRVFASWRDVADEAFVVVSAGQALAASTANDYVGASLAEQGVDPPAAGRIRPQAFAGVASDGRPLDSLLLAGPVNTYRALSRGASRAEARAAGMAELTMLADTQTADAGRAAVGVGIASTHRVGYARQLSAGACARCAVLAGNYYEWNAGFLRHPHCRCTHIPVSENIRGDITTDARAYFESLDTDRQNRLFTNAGAEAIREGGDVGQVVNARRGMTAAGTTTEGTARRFGATTDARLMPERTYREAASRDEAIELLRRHGYIV